MPWKLKKNQPTNQPTKINQIVALNNPYGFKVSLKK